MGGNSLISNYKQIYLGKTLTPAAVSTFFVISGYLYFANVTDFNRDVYITKTKKRIKSLIFPYLLWNLAGIIIISIKGSSLNFDSIGGFFSQLWCCNVWNENTFNLIGFNTPLYAPIDWPLWYLRDLIVMSLLSPVIYYTVRKLKLMYFVILVPLYIMNLWTTTPGFGLSAFIFFGMGVYLSINNRSIRIRLTASWKKVLVSMATVVSFISTYLWMTQGITSCNYSIYILATVLLVPSMLIIAEYMAKSGLSTNNLLVTSSFFVYSFHDFPGINPKLVVQKISALLQFDNSLFVYLISPFIVYAISVITYCLIHKYIHTKVYTCNNRAIV